MEESLRQSLKTLMIDVEDRKLRDEVLSLMTEHKYESLPECDRPSDAFKMSQMFQGALEKLVRTLKDIIEEKQILEVQKAEQFKKIEELKFEMSQLKRSRSQNELLLEKWLRDVDIQCQRMVEKINQA